MEHYLKLKLIYFTGLITRISDCDFPQLFLSGATTPLTPFFDWKRQTMKEFSQFSASILLESEVI